MLQKKKLQGKSKGPCWKFASYWDADLQSADCEEARTYIAGAISSALSSVARCIVQKLNEEFWDGSDLAGPAQRPSASFDVAAPHLEVLVFDGAQLK